MPSPTNSAYILHSSAKTVRDTWMNSYEFREGTELMAWKVVQALKMFFYRPVSWRSRCGLRAGNVNIRQGCPVTSGLRPAVTNILLWYPLIWPQHLWKWFERYGKVTASTPRESAKAHSDGSAMFKDQSFATCHMHNSQDGPYGMACISFNGLIKPPSTWLCTFTSLRVALHSNTSRVALASAAYLPHLSRFCTASICVPCLRDEGGHSHRADHPNWIHVRVAGLGGRFKSALFPNQSCQAKDINNLK